MSEFNKMFSYDKAVVLSALYDSLDALAFSVEDSNSVQGVFFVSTETIPRKKIKICIMPRLTKEGMSVQAIFQNVEDEEEELITALFDEMEAIIRKAGQKSKRTR